MINAAGIALLKEFERGKDPVTGKLLPNGVPATVAYNDRPDGTGVWTISWGLTGPDIKQGTVWTIAKCEARFAERIRGFVNEVLAACKIEPNENQLAAMVCLAFNIGMGWAGKKRKGDRDGFRQSTVLRMHNAEKYAEAAAAFSMWNKDNGEVKAGLTRRRGAETALYLTPIDDRPQTTRAVPDAGKDPATSKWNIPAATATATAALTGAQQVVAQVENVWASLYKLGINPHYLMAALGIAAVAGAGYFIYDQWARRTEGDR